MGNKYHARKIRNQHGEFDSKKEYNRYLFLKTLENHGEIRNLHRQDRFEILPSIYEKITTYSKVRRIPREIERCVEKAKYYTADFTYMQGEYVVVEDVKSTATKKARDYPLRRHLMRILLQGLSSSTGKKYIFKET